MMWPTFLALVICSERLRVLVVISHLPKDITARPSLPMWTLTSAEALSLKVCYGVFSCHPCDDAGEKEDRRVDVAHGHLG